MDVPVLLRTINSKWFHVGPYSFEGQVTAHNKVYFMFATVKYLIKIIGKGHSDRVQTVYHK
jgi:hypothetical protein